MNIRVTKKFNIEMGHALRNYSGLCKNIHGHSYKLEVTVIGKVKKDDSLNDNGMVVDFSVLKEIVKNKIIDVYDHALVIHRKIDIDKEQLKNFMDRLILTDYQPTCENLVLRFKNLIEPELPKEISLFRIFLSETATSYAEWYKNDN